MPFKTPFKRPSTLLSAPYTPLVDDDTHLSTNLLHEIGPSQSTITVHLGAHPIHLNIRDTIHQSLHKDALLPKLKKGQQLDR
jgi:hypothetical protein